MKDIVKLLCTAVALWIVAAAFGAVMMLVRRTAAPEHEAHVNADRTLAPTPAPNVCVHFNEAAADYLEAATCPPGLSPLQQISENTDNLVKVILRYRQDATMHTHAVKLLRDEIRRCEGR